MNIREEIDGYLDKVCSKVKFAKAHKGLKLELRSHIQDQAGKYSLDGMSKEEAFIKAIEEMGDPYLVGEELNSIHRPQLDWITIGLVGILMSFGIYVLVSLRNQYILGNYYMKIGYSQLIYMVIGILSMTILYFFDYTRLEKYSYLIYGLGLLITPFILRESFRGSISIMGFNLSIILPFLASILFIIGFSGIIERNKKSSIKGLIENILLASIPIFLYMRGAKTIIYISLGIIFAWLIIKSIYRGYYEGIKKKEWFALGVSLSLGGIYIINSYYFRYLMKYRIPQFFRRYEEPLGYGYRYAIIKEQLSRARLFGSNSIGGNMDILERLPDLKSDSILTYIIASLGWVPGIVLIGVSIFMIVRLIKMASKIKSRFGYNIWISITLFLSTQFILLILGNMGMAPFVYSYGLPFVSISGTTFVGNMILVGLLLSIWRSNNIEVQDEFIYEEDLNIN